MNYQHLAYLKEKGMTWFNPCHGIVDFWKEYDLIAERYQKLNHKQIWSHRNLKKSREILATAIIAKALEKSTGLTWWINKPAHDPPDGVVMTLIKNKIHVREVEVVESVRGNVLETIQNKLKDKRYEPNTILVCHLSFEGQYDLGLIHTQISKLNLPLSHIFCTFVGVQMCELNRTNKLYKYAAVQISPTYAYISIDTYDDCRRWGSGHEPHFYISEGLGIGEMRSIAVDRKPSLF